jgi:hypothetical protein
MALLRPVVALLTMLDALAVSQRRQKGRRGERRGERRREETRKGKHPRAPLPFPRNS